MNINNNGKIPALAPREQQILKRIIQGKTNKTIALELKTKEQTVKNQCSLLYKKLKVANRVGAVVLYLNGK